MPNMEDPGSPNLDSWPWPTTVRRLQLQENGQYGEFPKVCLTTVIMRLAHQHWAKLKQWLKPLCLPHQQVKFTTYTFTTMIQQQ